MGRKSKPYATMKDGPDKYLFRKDGKQKLVGSADNSPEDGEEELEESGYRYERDEELEFDGNNSKIWHYLITPDGERITLDHSPYQEMSPEEFDRHVNEFRRSSLKETNMTDELNELRKAAGLPIVEDCDESENAEKNDDGDCSPFTHADENVEMVREYEEEFEPATNMCPDCEGSGQSHMSQDSALPGLTGDCERCNGNGEIFEGEVEEDFLAPPKDVEGGEYKDDPWTGHDTSDYANSYGEDDDRIEPELDRQTDFDAPDRYDGDDSFDFPIDESTYTRKDFRMVADTLQNIGDPFIRQQQAEEYAAKFAASNPRFNRELFMQAAGVTVEEMVEGPGDDEFAHDDDAMVDIGDEDYDTGEDLSDLGGEYYGDSQYYETIEMNELRKAAGLEQVNEDKGMVDLSRWYEYEHGEVMSQIYWLKRQLPPADGSSAYARNWNKVVRNLSKKNPPPEGWVNPVGTPEPEEQTCPVCRGRGVNYAANDEPCYKCDGEGTIIETIEMTESESADNTTAFEFNNEQAYYAVADEIGDEISFGQFDEILVPAQHVDGIVMMLDTQGFTQGEDFKIPSVEEDLQNGYEDRRYVDGEDFFPQGSHQSPSDDLGPTASGYGDNAMKNRMRSKETDTVYEGMKQSYRRFRIEDQKKNLVENETLTEEPVSFGLSLAAAGFVWWAMVNWDEAADFIANAKDNIVNRKYNTLLADFQEQMPQEQIDGYAEKLSSKLKSTHPSSLKALAGRLRTIEKLLTSIPDKESGAEILEWHLKKLRGEMRRTEQFVTRSNQGHASRKRNRKR